MKHFDYAIKGGSITLDIFDNGTGPEGIDTLRSWDFRADDDDPRTDALGIDAGAEPLAVRFIVAELVAIIEELRK
jgi:hypothetical protein